MEFAVSLVWTAVPAWPMCKFVGWRSTLALLNVESGGPCGYRSLTSISHLLKYYFRKKYQGRHVNNFNAGDDDRLILVTVIWPLKFEGSMLQIDSSITNRMCGCGSDSAGSRHGPGG